MFKKIYQSNIREAGLLEGNVIEGKGTEIWEDIYAFARYNDFYPVIVNAFKEIKDVFVYSIRYTDDHIEKSFHCEEFSDIKRSENYFPIDKVIKLMEEDKVISVAFAKKPKLLGYIKPYDYKASLEGQKEFVEDLYNLKNEVFETNKNNIVDIKDEKELTLVHGTSLIPKGLEEYFDGKSYDFDELVLADFWRDFDGKIFDAIDPDLDVTIYHYKGKDWYVVPAAEEEELEICFENNGEEDSEIVTGYRYKINEKVTKKILKKLESIKQGLIQQSKDCM